MTWSYSASQHSMGIVGPCKYRIGVDCDKYSVCTHCGWSPEVEAARIEKLREAAKGETIRLPMSFVLGGATFNES